MKLVKLKEPAVDSVEGAQSCLSLLTHEKFVDLFETDDTSIRISISDLVDDFDK